MRRGEGSYRRSRQRRSGPIARNRRSAKDRPACSIRTAGASADQHPWVAGGAAADRSTTTLFQAGSTTPNTSAPDSMPGLSTSGSLALACGERSPRVDTQLLPTALLRGPKCIRSAAPAWRERGLHTAVSESQFSLSRFGVMRRAGAKSRNSRPNWPRLRRNRDISLISMTWWRSDSDSNTRYGSQ